MKILIVDDSMVIRRKIERCDVVAHMEDIKQAGNGVEAMEIFPQYQPNLITMDLTMPEMDGVECVKQMIAKDPDARILVVSALTDKETAIQAIKNGARGFLPKPFTEEQLNVALQKVLATS